MIDPAISLASPEGLAVAAPLIALGLIAAIMDLRFRRIPNWLCGLLAGLGLATAAWLGGLDALFMHGLHLVAALALGMGLFALRVFGGGDAKFYAAVAAWSPIGMWGKLALCISMSGLALLVVWFCYRRMTGKKIRPKNPSPHDSLPYGIAIAAGAIALVVS